MHAAGPLQTDRPPIIRLKGTTVVNLQGTGWPGEHRAAGGFRHAKAEIRRQRRGEREGMARPTGFEYIL